MNNVLRQWNAARIIRLVAGIGLGVYAIASKEYPFLFLAIFFLAQAILNISCCASGACASDSSENQVYKDIIKPYDPEKES
ncbi:hypothetical protein [Bacteroides pyogenes]|uniref:hypothetical protein n=1 Tax=Bacteroides pyogenes TaxID=310300 RepID=UPI0011E408CE|nr:hypothetical protein [Bacteroides pyogenes]MBR8705419.1 hypothetical protein [Bacteroides pyogenes]MBR8709871.1 hypothetical protein [Bacteroides pyogenes]MBR8718766.1 hypothetical protein [Bacteroides pyogenes]MBR8748231.1 hypothetical protein [Bacteroides pyogenes]MBR8758515.1 hypothetical protein [Bacteroides pyogenes]